MPIRWSIQVRDAADDRVLFEENAGDVLRTASIGKILLLVQAAVLIDARELDPSDLLTRTAEDAVADSGIWQHLAVDTLTVADLGRLIGMTSDNLATNVLLRRVGLDAVTTRAEQLGLADTRLLDRVRDQRGPTHPWTLSTGSAVELSSLLSRLHRGKIGNAAVSARVLGWLSDGYDLSMVAADWGLDPLAHTAVDRRLQLRHKTGTDDDVRCDVGLLTGPERTVAYAVLANWDPPHDTRDPVLARMHELGSRIRLLAQS